MKTLVLKYIVPAAAFVGLLSLLSACGNASKLDKVRDYSVRYELAKQYYAQGHYNRAAETIGDIVTVLKGTEVGEESLYLLGYSSFKAKSYSAAAAYFKKYYQSYPRGTYAERSRFNAGKALFNSTPEPKLDQTATYEAVTEYQNFIENYPNSPLRQVAQDDIFTLQDKLIEKELLSAKLYYNLGEYIGNGVNGNYTACIVTAENAIKDYPYTNRREDFSILILKSKFALAKASVDQRKEERYQDAIEEYYSFANEFPESKFLPEAKKLFASAGKYAPKTEDNNE